MTNDDKDLYARTMIGDQPWHVQQQQAQAAPAGKAPFAIDGYDLKRVLGRGGMGEVYLADRVNSAGVRVPCAIKTIIRDKGAEGVDFGELLLDEARLCANLRHPNVVSIMDVGHSMDRLYIAMELVEGIDGGGLNKIGKLRGRNLPFKHVLYVMREALQGLHYAHTAVGPAGQPLNIVHRDISPDNILISRQGAVKLADFGVALGRTAQNEAGQEMSAGKPAYKAPELWKGAHGSVKSDIFAMGATFYELMAGKPLFEMEDHIFIVMMKIVEFDVEKLIEEDLTLPEGIEDILRRSLAGDPDERYDSALEFLEDVNDFCFETGVRLLDAHFARFIEQMLDFRDAQKQEG